VTTDYKERDNAFTGKILKVTVDVKPIGAAVKAEADTGQHMAGVKKALSDESIANHAGRSSEQPANSERN
jgi:hypothetical protein